MKSKYMFLAMFFIFLITTTSCRKDLAGNDLTVEISTNDTIIIPGVYTTCDPGPNGLPAGFPVEFNYLENGNYNCLITEYFHEGWLREYCFTVTGTIPENNESDGFTILNINAFYTNEGNVVGFKEVKLKRPHEKYKINYEFNIDTYIE